MSFTFEHFNFSSLTGDGLEAFKNSVIVSAVTAVIGAILTFMFAYAIEKIDQLKFSEKQATFLDCPFSNPRFSTWIGIRLFL